MRPKRKTAREGRSADDDVKGTLQSSISVVVVVMMPTSGFDHASRDRPANQDQQKQPKNCAHDFGSRDHFQPDRETPLSGNSRDPEDDIPTGAQPSRDIISPKD